MAAATVNLVLTAIMDGDHILLIRRRNPPYRGYWGLPGGKMHFGEHVRDTALREAREETGLHPRYIDTALAATETITGPDGAESHFIMFCCRLEADGRETTPSREGELRWFSLADVAAAGAEERGFIPSDVRMLRAVAKGRRIPMQTFDVRREGDAFRVERFTDDA